MNFSVRLRKKKLGISLLILLALWGFGLGQGRAQTPGEPILRIAAFLSQPTDDPSHAFVPGVVLVRLAESTTRSQDAAQRLGVEPSALTRLDIPGQTGIYRLTVKTGEEEASAASLAAQSDVLFAEPDYLFFATEITPNDSLYAQYQWNLRHIRADSGWERTTGSSNVIIAIADTGIDLSHPDLIGKIVGGIDTVNNDFDPQDDNGHGTHVASTAASQTNNARGIAGVDWNARLMPIKVLNAAGSGSSTQVANGIIWATDNGAKVLNMSLAGTNSSSLVNNAIQYAYERGVLLVAAVGNSYTIGNPTSYPAAYEHVIGVAAVNDTDGHASYSNSGSYVDVAAPGGDPSSSIDGDPRHWIPGAYWRGGGASYAQLSGTSQAAPHVAGLAGLLLAINPTLTPDQSAQIITDSAVDVQSSGWDPFSGYGRIDVAAALDQVTPPPQPGVSVEQTLNQSAVDPIGVVAVGVEVTFTIRITNTGATALSVVPQQYLYESTYLTFERANPTPDLAEAGNLQWFNLAASQKVSPGSVLSVTVTFVTLTTTDDQPNRQTHPIVTTYYVQDEFGQQPPIESDDESLRVARSAVAIRKTISTPELSAVGTGVNITFNIKVENVGEVPIAHIPIYDLYETDVLQYLSTDISPPEMDVNGMDGKIFWSDITTDFGDLAPGQAVQFTATFRMIASRTTTNLVKVGDVRDTNGDPVPPTQGTSSVEVVPLAPPIYRLFAPLIGTQSPDNICPVPGCPVSGLNRPNGIAVHTRLNRLYINSRNSNQLIVLDARTLAPIAMVATGTEPWDVVVNENEGVNEVYISNYADGDVWIYDAETLALKKKVSVGGEAGIMELFPDINTVAVVAGQLQGIVFIENGTPTQYVPSGGTGPFGLAADQANKELIVTNRDTGNAWIIYKEGDSWRLNDRSEMKDFGSTQRTQPFEAAYNPANRRIYILYMMPIGTWFVDVIQKNTMADLRTIATIPVGSSGSDRNPDVGGAGMDINPVTGNLFVANTADDTVTVIGADNRVLETIPTGQEPFDLVVNRANSHVFIALRKTNRIQKFVDTY